MFLINYVFSHQSKISRSLNIILVSRPPFRSHRMSASLKLFTRTIALLRVEETSYSADVPTNLLWVATQRAAFHIRVSGNTLSLANKRNKQWPFLISVELTDRIQSCIILRKRWKCELCKIRGPLPGQRLN